MHPGIARVRAGQGERIFARLAILLSALFVLAPLLRNGPSCGHDFNFHLQNWMEIAAQWKGGVPWPRWAVHAAWNAGEPRFLFYPPLSWLAGGALTLFLPVSATPAGYPFLGLVVRGCSMRRVACRWVPPPVATLAGCLYLANPYMLFVSYERTAFAELLAAAWMPLLLLALLRTQVSVWRVALPVALLWLTNAPAAVVGCYSILLIGALRLSLEAYRAAPRAEMLRNALRTAAGTLLGLALATVYILPAAYERRYVQITMALVESLRPENNFLFAHTGNILHDQVLRAASWNAIELLSVVALCAGVYLLRRGGADTHTTGGATPSPGAPLAARTAVLLVSAAAACVALLLLHISAPLWRYAPELAFLQFPWRFLTVVAPSAALLAAFVLPRMRLVPAMVLALVCAFSGGAFGARDYGQVCDDEDRASTQAAAFAHGNGLEPTDEYTPSVADNDQLDAHDPELWLARQTDDPPSPAGSASQLHLLKHTPQYLSIRIDPQDRPSVLVVRLRRFPGWQVRDNTRAVPDLPERNDGLFAIPLTAGRAHGIVIAYSWTADQWLGLAISCGALALFAFLVAWERRGSAGTIHGSAAGGRVLSRTGHEANL